MELNNNEVLLDLAKSGLGIAFMPEYCVPKDNDDLITLDIFETLPKRKVIAAYDEESTNVKLVKEFLNMLLLRRQSFILV